MVSLTTVVVGLAIIYGLLHLLLSWTQDAREPPVAENTIPFLSPVIGMFRHKAHYYNRLRDQKGFDLPIYTLRLPGARAYVVNTLDLVPSLQRQWRSISFAPIMASAGQAGLGFSPDGADILHKDMGSDSNCILGSMPIMSRTLAPGSGLNKMVGAATRCITATTDGLAQAAEAGCGPKIHLFAWARHEMLMATTTAVYGPRNPYQVPSVEAAWLNFESAYLALVLSPVKALANKSGIRSRDALTSAFLNYFDPSQSSHVKGAQATCPSESLAPADASPFIQETHAYHASAGFSAADLARFEIGHTHALHGTTGTCMWWLLWHLYSDPSALADVRRELEGLADEAPAGEKKRKTLDVSLLLRHAPILHSTLKETLRYRSIATAVRMCLEDHVLADKWLLKKGAVVISPQMVHHFEPRNWASDSIKADNGGAARQKAVNEFDHRRFLRGGGGDSGTAGMTLKTPLAFRAFGGGHELCPGRHLATLEMLACAAVMVLRFDLVPVRTPVRGGGDGVENGGGWAEPTWEKTPVVQALQVPDEDLEVEVRLREGDASCDWHFVAGDGA